jgi:pimeloyl-ACP methyl ester carboxylesterase
LAKLKKIKCPVLVLAGDDEPFNSKMTFEMYEAIPSGRLAVIPGASHAVVNEKTKLMQELIKDFYKTLDFPITKMPNRRAKQQEKILRNS